MVLKNIETILLVKAQSLEIYLPKEDAPLVLELPPTIVKNFEIVDEIKLEKILFSFLAKNHLQKAQKAILLLTKCDSSDGQLHQSTRDLIEAFLFAFKKFHWQIKAAAPLDYFEDIRLEKTLSIQDRQKILKENLSPKYNFIQPDQQPPHQMLIKRTKSIKLNGGLLILLLGLLIPISSGFLIFASLPKKNTESQPETPALVWMTPSPSPSAALGQTEKKEDFLLKEEIQISILNGSGNDGEAGKIKKSLEKLGYKGISTGNTTSKIGTTVYYSSKISPDFQQEITAELKLNFVSVKEDILDKPNPDILIVTGK